MSCKTSEDRRHRAAMGRFLALVGSVVLLLPAVILLRGSAQGRADGAAQPPSASRLDVSAITARLVEALDVPADPKPVRRELDTRTASAEPLGPPDPAALEAAPMESARAHLARFSSEEMVRQAFRLEADMALLDGFERSPGEEEHLVLLQQEHTLLWDVVRERETSEPPRLSAWVDPREAPATWELAYARADSEDLRVRAWSLQTLFARESKAEIDYRHARGIYTLEDETVLTH